VPIIIRRFWSSNDPPNGLTHSVFYVVLANHGTNQFYNRAYGSSRLSRRMPMPPHKPMTFRWTSQWEPVHTHRYASNARRKRVADTLPPTIHCGHCKTLNPRTPTGDDNLNNSNKNKDHLRLGNLRSSSWRVEMVPSPSSASATDVRLHNFLREPSFVATVFDQLHPVKPSGTRPPARESPPSPGTP